MATITAAAPVRRPRSAVAGRRPSAPRPTARRAGAPLRLTARGRVVLLVGLVVLAAGLVLGLGLGAASAVRTSSGPATTTVVVQPGQTLWQIAVRVAPDADPRVTVDRLQRLNGLSGSLVVPGQSLVVPVTGS